MRSVQNKNSYRTTCSSRKRNKISLENIHSYLFFFFKCFLIPLFICDIFIIYIYVYIIYHLIYIYIHIYSYIYIYIMLLMTDGAFMYT